MDQLIGKHEIHQQERGDVKGDSESE